MLTVTRTFSAQTNRLWMRRDRIKRLIQACQGFCIDYYMYTFYIILALLLYYCLWDNVREFLHSYMGLYYNTGIIDDLKYTGVKYKIEHNSIVLLES